MAWIYLAESEESQSPSKNGSDQLPTARSTPIVKENSSREWLMVHCLDLLSGMTYLVLRDANSSDRLTLCTVDSHAKTLALQDLERAWKESEADYFSRSLGCVARLSQDSSFWKTSLPLLPAEEQKWSGKLPKWAMTVDRVLYQLHPLERRTCAKDGFCLPTPNTLDHMAPRSEEAQRRVFQTHRKGRTYPSNLREWIIPEMWPGHLLPTVSATEGGPMPPDTKYRPNQRSYNDRTGKHVQITVRRWMEMLPTPQACDSTKGPAKEFIPNGKQSSMRNLVTYAARMPTHIFQATGKTLNPLFVEWMMEYPIGYTELEPWAMQWFQAKRKKRSKC